MQVQLCIDAIQGLAKGKRQNGGIAGEHGHRRAENSRLQSGEQPRDFPAVGSHEVSVGSWWAVDQAFKPQPAKVECHLVGSLVRHGHSQQIGYLFRGFESHR